MKLQLSVLNVVNKLSWNNNEWNLHRNDSSAPVEDQIVSDQLILAMTKDLLVEMGNYVNPILFRCFRDGFDRLLSKKNIITVSAWQLAPTFNCTKFVQIFIMKK